MVLNLSETVSRAEHIIQWLDQKIEGMQFVVDRRTAFAVPCFDVAVEHYKSIVLLIANQLPASGLALVRLLFESYIRGIWLHHCASDAEIELFSKDRFDGRFGHMLTAVEQIEQFNTGVLSDLKDCSWRAMNSYTHTGMLQVSQRQIEGCVGAGYSDGVLIEAVDFACSIACLVSIAICEIAGDAETSAAIIVKAQEVGLGTD